MKMNLQEPLYIGLSGEYIKIIGIDILQCENSDLDYQIQMKTDDDGRYIKLHSNNFNNFITKEALIKQLEQCRDMIDQINKVF